MIDAPDYGLVTYTAKDIIRANPNIWFRVRTITNMISKLYRGNVNKRRISMIVTITLNNMVANDECIRIKKGQTYLYKIRQVS